MQYEDLKKKKKKRNNPGTAGGASDENLEEKVAEAGNALDALDAALDSTESLLNKVEQLGTKTPSDICGC